MLRMTPAHCYRPGDVLLKPIAACAGTDISGWFDVKTKDIRTHIDPITLCTVPYTPRGRFLHIPPPIPRSDWANTFGTPWWKDSKYFVGQLSAKTRKLKIVNMLTAEETVVEVCGEETITEILQRYLVHNRHVMSYTWKHHGKLLDMAKTLDENGIHDESADMFKLAIDEDQHIPEVQLYYNDDLTEG